MVTKVGLAAGRYSGTSRPDLKRTPQALHRVFGPIGPVRHCGVFSEAQWRHFRPGVSAGCFLIDGVVLWIGEGATRRRREDQSQGAARERLLLALPGTETSVEKIGGECVVVTEEEVSVAALLAAAAEGAVVFEGMKWRSSVEKDSSTKFDSHSSSAKSSYGTQSSLLQNCDSLKLRQLTLPLNCPSPPDTDELQLSTAVTADESPEFPPKPSKNASVIVSSALEKSSKSSTMK